MSSSERSLQAQEKKTNRVPAPAADLEKQAPPAKPTPPSALRQLISKPRRVYKTWIRCCIVLAVSVILLVAPKTSNTMGQAGFFTAVLAIFLPPSLALSVFFMASLTLLFGMLLGWAWSCAGMASALSVRSPELLAQQRQLLQSMLDPNSTIPIPVQIQMHTFEGIFLDPRSSAVYGAFLFIGAFAMGVLRAYFPRLLLMSTMGTIVLDVMTTVGPFFPTAQYTIAKVFLIPVAFYVAVALASLVIIFPESLNHVWLTALQSDFITPTHQLLDLLKQSLDTPPSAHEEWQQVTDKGNGIRARLVGGTENVLAQIGLIDIDTSVGRLGPGDLKRICGELKGLLIRTAALHAFNNFVNDKNRFDKEAQEMVAQEARGAAVLAENELREAGDLIDLNTATCVNPSKIIDTFHRMRCKVSKRERADGHDFDTLMPIIASSSLGLREACEEGIVCFSDWVDRVNGNRWGELFSSLLMFKSRKDPEGGCQKRRKRREEDHREMEEVVKRLGEKLIEFRTVERERLIKPYERYFDPVTRKMKVGEEGEFTTRTLYMSFVFIDTLDMFAEALVKTLRVIISIDAQRKRVRLWFPGWALLSPKKLKEQVVGQGEAGEGGENPMSMGTNRDPTSFRDSNRSASSTSLDLETPTANGNGNENGNTANEPSSPTSPAAARPTGNIMHSMVHPRLNPDAFPPKSKWGRWYIAMCAIFRFLKSPEGVFGLKIGIVSVALWVPSVCKSSAWIYYNHKGLWALIMSQMALAVYAGDQIAGFFIRMLGTLIGLVIGMALWYMGAGRGNGNPYGIVVVTTVFLAPFLYMRLVGSPRLAALWIMIPFTSVFVVGYSWINANQNLISHPGIGVTLGWRRALLVIIGFAAAFVVMFFPNPQSSRVLVRKTASGIITELGRILAGEIEAFLAEEERARKGFHEKVVFRTELDDEHENVSMKERRGRRVVRRVVEVSTRLRDIMPSLETAKFEPQLSGVWPQNEYRTLLQLENRMLSSLVLLISSFEKLDTKHCGMLVHQTPYLNPNFIADIFSTLSILSSSLQTGSPLPPYLPKLRERILYHEQRSGHGGFKPSRMLRTPRTLANPALQPISQSSSSDADFEDDKGDFSGNNSDGYVRKLATPTPTTSTAMSLSDYDMNKIRPERIDGVTMGLETITLDTLLDEQLPAYSAALTAFSSIIFRIDAMSGIVKTLCGQMTIPGYANLQRDYFDWEERNVGGNA